jgi:hypothetical protein
MSEGTSQSKMSGMVAEPGLFHSPCQCVDAHCFVSAAVFATKNDCGPPPSLLA